MQKAVRENFLMIIVSRVRYIRSLVLSNRMARELESSCFGFNRAQLLYNRRCLSEAESHRCGTIVSDYLR